MIFKRRARPSLWQRLREFLSPRKGFWRGVEYLGQRLRRLPDSPHRIALGFACGALASFTPLFGLHFFLAAGLAWLVRGNVLASAFGTIVGNPLTFPFIATLSVQTGLWLFDWPGVVMPEKPSIGWVLDNVESIFLPYLVGGVLPGLAAAAVSYWTLGPVVAAYQERRRKVLAERAERRRQLAMAEQDAYRAYDAEGGDNA